MPSKETRILDQRSQDQRLQFWSSYRREEISVTELGHAYGISRPSQETMGATIDAAVGLVFHWFARTKSECIGIDFDIHILKAGGP
jgi:hypothetical protein